MGDEEIMLWEVGDREEKQGRDFLSRNWRNL